MTWYCQLTLRKIEMAYLERNTAPMAAEDEITAIELDFMEAWEAGSNPTLQDYVARYPQHAGAITEFVLGFLELEGALARTPLPVTPSAAAEQAVKRALQAVFAPAENLKQVRMALGLDRSQLAQELNLPSIMILWLEGGDIMDSDTRLEAKLGHLTGRTPSQTRLLLGAPAPPAAPLMHLKATGTPRNTPAKRRTFREALEECDRQGLLTDGQRREWLPEQNI